MQIKPVPTKPAPVDFQSLSNDAHIRETGLIPAVIPVSRGTLWRWVKKKQFPAPVKLSAGVTAWRVGDVRAFLASKA